jgi:tetratricopeptide (TPR) repeat protein
MDRGPGRIAFLTVSLLLAFPLFALLGGEPVTGSLLLPWEPMLRAPSDFGDIQSALAGVTRGNLRERLATLQGIYDDEARPKAQRGLAAFSAAVLLSENLRGSEAAALFRSPSIQATELSGYALFFAARELELSRPQEARALLEEVEANQGDVAIQDDARLLLARLLRRAGEREAAAARYREVAKSRDEKLRGEALEELGVLLSESKQYDEAAVALETLYYELPWHPRAPAAGRELSIVRGKVPPVDAQRH